jgi:hypothetical protein
MIAMTVGDWWIVGAFAFVALVSWLNNRGT